jgi:hypothetical protein
MKQIARLANPQIYVFFAVAMSAASHDLRVSGQEVAGKKTTAERNVLRQAVARKDRLRRDLSRLIASTPSGESRHGFAPDRLAAAAKRIRRLGEDLQESEVEVSSLKLARARAINRIAPGVVSREEMCRLQCQNQIDLLLLEKKRLRSSMECPEARSRIAETEVTIAALRLQIARANLSETSRFPPKTIPESEYRRLQSEVAAARRRLANARLDNQRKVH